MTVGTNTKDVFSNGIYRVYEHLNITKAKSVVEHMYLESDLLR